MKELNLEKVWAICNTLANKMHELAEESIYVELLGSISNYAILSFEEFLNYYSFKINSDTIEVFNNDNIPYSDYTNEDYSYVPTVLLSFAPEKIDSWMETEIKLQLAKQELKKETNKEYIKLQIKRLQEQLNN